ncbi:hypothetical protein [Pseudonocardia acaciae]|uniref:hypothetical protein n=1 Tax=Pseudonocardia acaciae TaxID=551276 RepID=UPI000491623E|nr:hypothetical protein [Pseudonocardia acaciae]
MTSPRKRSREEYERGLPDYHDPTAGVGGAAPTLSPLTLRAVIAGIMILITGGAGGWMFAHGYAGFGIAFVVLGLVSVGDLLWVLHRKHRGEPG